MREFILRQNIARYRAALKEERDALDIGVIRQMLAKALREYAILEAQSEGLLYDVDLVSASKQRTMFRNLFETSDEPYLLLDPRNGLHIMDINDAYGKSTLTSTAKVAGNRLFDVFPDNPDDLTADGVSNLFASLTRVVECGGADPMAVQRYDVRDANGIFLTKFWKPVNRPIFDQRGRLIYLLHHVEDVTEKLKNT